VLGFIDENFDTLKKNYVLISKLLLEWQHALPLASDTDAKIAANVVLKLLNEYIEVENFRVGENDLLRRDNYEGNTWVSNLTNSDVYLINEQKQLLLGNASDVHTRGFKESLKGNVFCMYAIHPDSLDGKLSIDRRVENFGSHFVAIKSGYIERFLNRVWQGLEFAGISIYGADLVKYYNAENSFFSFTDIFMKRAEYSYQNEFRIFAHSNELSTFTIQIGCLRDLATIHKTADIFRNKGI